METALTVQSNNAAAAARFESGEYGGAEYMQAEEASVERLYSGAGVSTRRRFDNNWESNPRYRAGFTTVLDFIEKIYTGKRPLYHLTEVMTGRRELKTYGFRETLATSDFNFLFGDILDRQLLAQYASVEPTWTNYARRGTVNDFRVVKRFTLDGLRAPLTQGDGVGGSVPEATNYPVGKVSDNGYSYGVNKYGRVVPLSWESIVNDDLGAFTRIPALFAQAANNTEEQFVTRLLLNATGINTTYFSNTNKNIVNQANGAKVNNPPLSVAGLQDGMTVLMRMLDSDNAPIAVKGATLVVGPQLAIDAANVVQNISQIRIGAGGSASASEILTYTMPEWLKNLKVEVNYYFPLVNQSAAAGTTWMLIQNPALGRPAMEVGFLRGHEQPEIFIKNSDAQRLGAGAGGASPMDGSFTDDSLQYKVRHVFGGILMDVKAAVVSRGDGLS